MSRRIIVSHRLPLQIDTDPYAPYSFVFSLDFDSLPYQLSSSLPSPAIFIGTLPPPFHDPPRARLDEISDQLLSQFNCIPVFIPSALHHDFYDQFCERYLRPLLHSLPTTSPFTSGGLHFDSSLYDSYLRVNELFFAKRITDILNVEQDFIWVHDYHLIPLATFIRRIFPRVKIGFFLHSPFPAFETFLTTTVRENLLNGLLNFDLVGFRHYDYARHFPSSCLRVLGVRHQSKGANVAIEYHGRKILVKVLPVEIDMNQLQEVLNSPETATKIKELNELYQDRMLMVAVDDVDVFRVVDLKFLAMEKVLEVFPELQGVLVLVQIINPAQRKGRDIQAVQLETRATRDRINTRFGHPGYEPIVLIEGRPVPMSEKAAFFAMADCCIINAVRDGLNSIPYIYTVCRELGPALNDGARDSLIVVSEFVGFSPSLSGAIRVNPWDIESVWLGMISALSMKDMERQLRHEKHYKCITSTDVAYWARSFDQDLQRACEGHSLNKNYYFLGFGMNLRVVAVGSDFETLSEDKVVLSYKKTRNRLVVFDYDGIMVPQGMTDKRPTEEVIRIFNGLCADPLNVIFVISGAGKDELAQWFKPCEKLVLVAEHGYYIRWDRKSPWETSFFNNQSLSFGWIDTVMHVMQMYTEVTHGSYIESKDSAVAWHYQNAGPHFGSFQANDLLEKLESVLANEPTNVKKGHKFVEVIPQGINKGVVMKRLIEPLLRGKYADFVLCIGDDSSDEDMFEAIRNYRNNPMTSQIEEVFECTVGNKPSKAKYYLDDIGEVLKMLKALVESKSIN